jgi:hypothetical protein
MNSEWQISSLIPDIFNPPENPIMAFIKAVDSHMNGNTVLLKVKTGKPIPANNRFERQSFLHEFREKHFLDLFLEFDRATGWFDYHEWHDTPESKEDFYAGYKPRIQRILKPDSNFWSKPMSYLCFIERLHWMQITSFGPYLTPDDIDEKAAGKIIHDLLPALFGPDTWNIDDPPTSWVGMPNWISHPWSFFDVMPNFLHSTGYWEHWKDEEAKYPDNAYFDSGEADSCTIFFHNTTFYMLLTNGSP